MILKQVLIIAIVAVAMIGVMVPSVFAEYYAEYLDETKKVHEGFQKTIDVEYTHLINGEISPEKYIVTTMITSDQLTVKISELIQSRPTDEWQESYISYMNGMKKFNEYIIETRILANLIDNSNPETEINETKQKMELLKKEIHDFVINSEKLRPTSSQEIPIKEANYNFIDFENIILKQFPHDTEIMGIGKTPGSENYFIYQGKIWDGNVEYTLGFRQDVNKKETISAHTSNLELPEKITDLSATCYSGWFNENSFKRLVCVKDNEFSIILTVNKYEDIPITLMKNILSKIDSLTISSQSSSNIPVSVPELTMDPEFETNVSDTISNKQSEGIKAKLDRNSIYYDSAVTITGSVENIIDGVNHIILQIEQTNDGSTYEGLKGRLIDTRQILINSDKSFSYTIAPFDNWKSVENPPWNINFNLLYGDNVKILPLELYSTNYGQILLQSTPDKESYEKDDTLIISNSFLGLYQNVIAGFAINKDGKDIIFQDNVELTPRIPYQLKIPIDEKFENGRYEIWLTVNSEQVNEITGKYHKNYFGGSEFFVNDIHLDVSTESLANEGGGCIIATATYGSELAPQVQQLRELRDNQLLQTESGTAFMGAFNDIYYSFSPIVADYERENLYFKEAVKLAITPMISSLSLMENAETESEVLSIGISVIMLNLGMYLGVPAIVVIGIRKKF